MQSRLGQGETDKKQFLAYNCDSIEQDKGYMRQFTHEELLEMREGLTDVSIALNDFEEEKKAFMDALKLKMKPLMEEKQRLLEGLKKKAEYVKEDLFKFIDTDERMVGFYNSEGLLVEQRPCFINELQGNLFKTNNKYAI